MDTNGIKLTPKDIVSKLNEYIVGQNDAKRVAIALRNRYRRSLLKEEEKQEIAPKNILMIGPTGVGKTEIARRMAKLLEHRLLKSRQLNLQKSVTLVEMLKAWLEI